MITVPTVLVLGAGASVPFGFPSGRVLVDIITYYFYSKSHGYVVNATISGLGDVMVQMRQMLVSHFSVEKVDSFVEHLIGEESIDAFLEHQTGDFLEIGKAAIAGALLPFERERDLDSRFTIKRLKSFFDPERQPQGTEDNWYQLLWGALNAPFETFHHNALHIITFNYDRSLEHYLFTRLKRRFPDKSDEDYAARVCPIVHIHGRLGRLPWQPPDAAEDARLSVPYGAMSQRNNDYQASKELELKRRDWLNHATQRITVIHEANEETDELRLAREWIRDCKRLYFLGFGYHPTNVGRLQLKEVWDKTKSITGTVRGLSLERYEYVRNLCARLSGAWGSETEHRTLVNADAYAFLHDHVNLTR